MAGRGRETTAKSDGKTNVCAVFDLIDSGEVSFAASKRNNKLKSKVMMIFHVWK